MADRYEVDPVYYDRNPEPEFQIWDREGSTYIETSVPGEPWHHWIKEIADAHCQNLNNGKI
jgi:hypothetical protein